MVMRAEAAKAAEEPAFTKHTLSALVICVSLHRSLAEGLAARTLVSVRRERNQPHERSRGGH